MARGSGEVKMTKTEDIVAQLIKIRVALGHSQGEVARRAGVPHDSLSKWERSHYVPNDENVAKWASALGMRLVITRSIEPMEVTPSK